MNKIAMTALASALTSALALATPAFADDAHHPEKAQEAKAAPAKPEQDIGKMRDNVKKMQPQLDRIAKAKTDDERRKAIAEHMQTMQENMKMARGMMHAGMMSCPMMEGGMGMMGKGAMGMMGDGAPSGGAPERMQQMEKRMDMMQMMMEQMMRRSEGGAMPAPTPMK